MIFENKTEREHYLTQLIRLTKEIETKYPKEVHVPDNLIKPDPLIKEARTDLRSKKPSSWRSIKTVINSSRGQISISVTKENVSRALRFMNAFIKLIRLRGHRIDIVQGQTMIFLSGQKYEILLREKHTRHKTLEGTWERSELIPNGILSLKIVEPYSDKEWNGTKKTPIENQLAKFVAALELQAIYDNIRNAEIKRNSEERERLHRIEKRKKAEKEWEEKKTALLRSHSDNWLKSRELQSFIEKVDALTNESTSIKVRHWIEWAKEQKNVLDPFSEGIEAFVAKYDFPEDQFTPS